MRKTLLVATFSLSALATPAHAEDLKAYLDCMAFVTRWCKLAQEEAAWWERLAVDLHCMGLYSNCSAQLVKASAL